MEALLDREGEQQNTGRKEEVDTDKALAVGSLVSRMDRLEEKMDQILVALEAKQIDKVRKR